MGAGMVLCIPGRPATKKNSPIPVRIRREGGKGSFVRIIPSAAYRRYLKSALKHLLPSKAHITGPVQVVALYWLPDLRWWPDLLGLEQATADILEAANIISSDRNIVSWGESRIAGLDKDFPRTEIRVVEVEPPDWWLLLNKSNKGKE